MAKTFLAAVRQYFGVRVDGYKGDPGLKGFAAEIKALTPKDREELRALLAAELNEEVTA